MQRYCIFQQLSEWRTTSRETQIEQTAQFAAFSPRPSASTLPELSPLSVQQNDAVVADAAAIPSEGVPPQNMQTVDAFSKRLDALVRLNDRCVVLLDKLGKLRV